MPLGRTLFLNGCSCVAALAVTASLAQTSRPTSRPATRPATRAASRPTPTPTSRPDRAANKPSQDALRVAVAQLTKEGTQALSKKEAFPRATSDYFSGKPSVVAVDDLLKVLTQQIARDPRLDAYVKLQLLSAVEKFDEAHARAAISAYVIGAPPLVPVPNSQKDMTPWEARKFTVKKKGDEDKVNDDYAAWRAPYEAQNEIILRVRDALRDHVTVTEDTKPKLLQARIEDLSQRATAGLDTWKQQGDLFKEVVKWTALASKAQVHEMIQFLGEYRRREGGELYDKLIWGSRGAYWRKRNAGLDDTKLGNLLDKLKEAETNAL